MTLATDTLTVSFFDSSGSMVDISDLDPPAEVEIPLSNMTLVAVLNGTRDSNGSDASTVQAYCAYWSTRERRWVTESAGQLVSGSLIRCNTTHFTDFAVFVGPPPQFNELASMDELRRLPETNPFGFAVSMSMLVLTLLVCMNGVKQYRRFVRRASKPDGEDRDAYETDAGYFAWYEQQLNDADVPWSHRAPGKLRTRWLGGSVMSPVRGDPWLPSQRAFGASTTTYSAHVALRCQVSRSWSCLPAFLLLVWQ